MSRCNLALSCTEVKESITMCNNTRHIVKELYKNVSICIPQSILAENLSEPIKFQQHAAVK